MLAPSGTRAILEALAAVVTWRMEHYSGWLSTGRRCDARRPSGRPADQSRELAFDCARRDRLGARSIDEPHCVGGDHDTHGVGQEQKDDERLKKVDGLVAQHGQAPLAGTNRYWRW